MPKRLWLGIGAAVIAAGVLAVGLWTAGNAFRLSIDGLAVTTEEYLYMMNAQKYAVSTALEEQYGLQAGAGFWSARAGDKATYEVLAERTVDALREYRALYGLAEERGYVDDISHAALKKRLENENALRAEKIAKGETVYGVERFTLDTFLDYEEDAIRTRYCNEPTNPGMELSEEILRAKYEEVKDARFLRDDSRSLTYIEIDCAELDDVQAQSMRGKLTQLAGGTGSLYDLAMADPELAPYVRRRDLTYSDYRAASMEIPEMLDLVWALNIGERSAVKDENGVLLLAECAARTSGGYTPYEEARDYLVKSMREETFDAMVAQRAEAAEVTSDMDSVYRLTKKSVE